MAGKSETMKLVDHQKQNKWRENSTARATTEVKEMAGKSATTHGSAEAKNGGKILLHVRRGGKRRENPKPTASDGGNRGWLAML